MPLTPRSPEEFNVPEIDFGLKQDEALGEVIAQAKVKAMKQGFDAEYDRGVNLFLGEYGYSSRDEGQAIASMLLEERRKTLIQAGKNCLLYGVCAASVSWAVGLNFQQAIAASIPAIGAGVYLAGKE